MRFMVPYTVYRTINDIYVGEAILDDSHRDPLSPDNWLIPAGCVTVPPPALADGEQARWDQDAWVIEAIPKEEPITINPPTAAMVKGIAWNHLFRTDWYIIRQMETGKAVPESVTTLRAAIRASYDNIVAMDPIPDDYYADKYWPQQPPDWH